MDPTEGSETSANINQTLGIHPKVETVKTVISVHHHANKMYTSRRRNTMKSEQTISMACIQLEAILRCPLNNDAILHVVTCGKVPNESKRENRK
jgi:hypothetical protein